MDTLLRSPAKHGRLHEDRERLVDVVTQAASRWRALVLFSAMARLKATADRSRARAQAAWAWHAVQVRLDLVRRRRDEKEAVSRNIGMLQRKQAFSCWRRYCFVGSGLALLRNACGEQSKHRNSVLDHRRKRMRSRTALRAWMRYAHEDRRSGHIRGLMASMATDARRLRGFQTCWTRLVSYSALRLLPALHWQDAQASGTMRRWSAWSARSTPGVTSLEALRGQR